VEEDLPSMRSGGEGVGAQARVHKRIVVELCARVLIQLDCLFIAIISVRCRLRCQLTRTILGALLPHNIGGSTNYEERKETQRIGPGNCSGAEADCCSFYDAGQPKPATKSVRDRVIAHDAVVGLAH